MHPLLRPLAASTVLSLLALAPAAAQRVAAAGASTPAPAPAPQAPAHAAPQIRLVRVSAVPRPDGREIVRYDVFQRMSPLLAVNEDGLSGADDDVVVSPKDDVEVTYEMVSAGWQQFATLTVESIDPGAAAPRSPARAAAAAPAEDEPALPKVLALAPVRPNPVSGRALVVDVALPLDRPARLELLDVMGRVVASRDLGALGAGRHAVDLSAGLARGLSPGVYLLRLTQAGEARVTRVAVID